jgi:hypothetical protein
VPQAWLDKVELNTGPNPEQRSLNAFQTSSVDQGASWALKQSHCAPGASVLQLPADPATGFPYPTYYFRTHFNFEGAPEVALLTLTNYIDDGAIFYLNGAEVFRRLLISVLGNICKRSGNLLNPVCPGRSKTQLFLNLGQGHLHR